MLNIGRKTLRNLPEQVGFLTGEVAKIWEALDGLDVYDNVIVLDSLNPLTPAQLEIVNKPVAFIVYNNTLYMKRGVGPDKVYFDAVFQVSLGEDEDSGKIFFGSSEIVVNYPLGTLDINNLTTGTYGYAKIDELLALKADKADTYTKAEILAKTYPVGAIYLSADSTSPASLFGGTWEQLENRFLLGAGSDYMAGVTGGETEHTLTINEMPSHNHNFSPTENIGSGGVQPDGGTIQKGYSGSPLSRTFSDIYNLESQGGGQAHNNMPPYLAVYMWKRVA